MLELLVWHLLEQVYPQSEILCQLRLCHVAALYLKIHCFLLTLDPILVHPNIVTGSILRQLVLSLSKTLLYYVSCNGNKFAIKL